MRPIRLLVMLAMLAPVALAQIGTVQGASSASCDLKVPASLGGCGAHSPYTDEVRAGIAGFGPAPSGSGRGFSGWVEVLNTGPVMPHLVVEVGTGGSFIARNAYAVFNTGRQKYRRAAHALTPPRSGYAWDFGSFPDGVVATVHFRIRLTNGCSYRMDLRTYGDVLPSGSVNPAALAWGNGYGASGSAGNCPIPPPQ